MERYMYRDESFEGMLKEKADEYKMYPSQQSWENIQKRIRHQNRLLNFKSIGLSALLLIGFSISLSDDQTTTDKTDLSSIVNTSSDLPSIAASTSATISGNRSVAKIIPITTAVRVMTQPTAEAIAQRIESLPASEETFTIAASEEATQVKDAAEKPLVKATIAFEPTSLNPSLPLKLIAEPASTDVVVTTQEPIAVPEPFLSDADLNYEVKVPTITVAKEKKQFQLHITPSASYRVLYSDNKFTFGNFPQQNPDNVVRHRPSLGLEAGASILFPVSKNLKFRTGLQFNFTRHNVEVFRATPQLTTVLLNYSGTIQRVSSLNSNGNRYLMTEVANETYQISIPVGLELKLAGKRKVQWNVAANVQPSYLLAASGYLLTNDLKKYIKAPDLLSNLNLNTALETFLRWDVNDIQLQAGPQLRYQLFSNVRGDYPIKEHLVDYGFRIGIVKTLR
jgi:Outer membrane protein beta-barrel domain